MATTRFVLATAIALIACTPRGRAPELEPKSNTAAVSGAPSVVAIEPAAPVKKMPAEPFTLRDDRERAIEVYPPIAQQPRAPMVVFLHATCMQPSSVCNGFGSAARDTGWLVCPSGNSTCYGEPDWHGPGREKAAFLESALARVEAELPTFIDDRPGVLIGWSRGAFAARDILTASIADQTSSLAKRFRGLVLIAAHVTPELAMLKQAGVTRVVMAAGDHDISKPTMVSAVAALRKGGLDARFISLGNIGHVWPNDFEMRMREPIAWAAGGS